MEQKVNSNDGKAQHVMEYLNSDDINTKLIGIELLENDKDLFIAVLDKITGYDYFKFPPEIITKLKALVVKHGYPK